jgi:hypothetical protein
MNKISFTVTALFSLDKSITLEFIPEAIAYLREKAYLAEGKTRGSWGVMPDGKTIEFRPYAQADATRRLVKDEEKIGVYSNIQRLKTKCRITTALPIELNNDQAKRLYQEDAALVAEAIGNGAFKPASPKLEATNVSKPNPQPAA